jgi:hypothetical protein
MRAYLRLLLGSAIALIATSLAAIPAAATHPHPKSATPLRVSLVLANKPCVSPNEQHGAPLAVPSCDPPQQASSSLTVGTGDAWPGTSPKSVGSVRLDAKTSSPVDLLIHTSIMDVRCIGDSAPGFCTTANLDNSGLPDYSGDLNQTINYRLTDHNNGSIGVCGTGCADPATVQDLAFPITTACATTPDGTVGSTCNASTTANTIVPGAFLDTSPLTGGRIASNIEIHTINVYDGGADGDAQSSGDNTLFETQGIWVP